MGVGSENEIEGGEFDFEIRGLNPSETSVRAELPDDPWWVEPMVFVESGETYDHFTDDGLPVPNEGGDGGYGLMQLTIPAPTMSQVWSWRLNVQEGLDMIDDAIEAADDWMDEEDPRPGQNFPHGQRPQSREDVGHVPRSTTTIHGITFSTSPIDDERDATEGCAIKIYNGAAQHFCVWNRQEQVWEWHPESAESNHVENTCRIAATWGLPN